MVNLHKTKETRIIEAIKSNFITYTNWILYQIKSLWPTICIHCNNSNTDYICQNCIKDIRFNPEKNAISIKGVKTVLSLNEYDGAIKKLIHEFKFNNNIKAGKLLNKLLIEKTKNTMLHGHIWIGVPSYTNKRNFNTLEIIFKKWLNKHNQTTNKHIIKRIKKTKSLHFLNKKERLVELENSFKIINGEEIKNKIIIIFDDIITTGSTIQYISNELRKYHPKEIHALTYTLTKKK